MTNDYAALVAMLDQAAADLQAEIDAAIDRHGLLVRTADSLRAEAAPWPPGVEVLARSQDALDAWRQVAFALWGFAIEQPKSIHPAATAAYHAARNGRFDEARRWLA